MILLDSSPMDGILMACLVGAVTFGLISLFGSLKEKGKNYSINSKLKNNPNDIEALKTLGGNYLKKKDFENAIGTYERIVKVDPHNFDAFLKLGILHHSRKEYEKSERYLSTLVKHFQSITNEQMRDLRTIYGDDIGFILYYYGHVLFLKGDTVNAADYKMRALNISRTFSNYGLY